MNDLNDNGIHLTYEWIVEEDGDPRTVVRYRGPDQDQAYATLMRCTPVAGWGARLIRRLVGPKETVEIRQ